MLVDVAREFGNARRVAGQARKVISKVFIEARLGKAPRVAEVTPVVEDIYASIERNPYAFSGLMRCKSEMEAIYQHMLSVSALMVSLARQLGLSPQETRTAGMAGLLLDVGVSRLDIDPTTLAGGLKDIDADLWHRHCYVGRDLLAAAEDVPEEVLQSVVRHHELMDGTGFPQALTGQDIDLISRMAAICDRYDLLVSGAATGDAMDPAEAMRLMMGREGAFDGEILIRFQEALGLYPVGSFVRLRSDRIAIVIDQDPSEPTLPTVRAFFSIATGKHVKAKVIELANCFGEDAIAGIANLSELGLPPAEELREQLLTAGAR
ncbi:MAG: HD domain-containing phosphohydrolase [Novosphingobium sp.]